MFIVRRSTNTIRKNVNEMGQVIYEEDVLENNLEEKYLKSLEMLVAGK